MVIAGKDPNGKYREVAVDLEGKLLIGGGGGTSLDAVEATGNGEIIALDTVKGNHALQVTHTGTPDAVVVQLLASLDGVTFTQIAEWNSSSEANGETIWVTNTPALFLRAVLGTLTAGTDPTVTAIVGSS